MTAHPDLWQRLNAYVDGELDPQARAEIAAEIARDRQLAAAAATLARLKAATGEAFGDAPEIGVGAPAPRPPRRAVTALAATAAAVVAFAAVWLGSGPNVPATLDLAVARHAAWVAGEAPASVEPLAAPLLVGLAQLGRPAELPDLRDSGLQIARISALDTDRGPAGLHVAYLGSRGCRISLFVVKAEPEHVPLRLQVGGLEVARWTVDDLAYTLLASGMPEARFALIAASAEDAVRRHRPIPEPMREALRRDRDASPPCAG
jgi:anti-sigma factor RsiW